MRERRIPNRQRLRDKTADMPGRQRATRCLALKRGDISLESRMAGTARDPLRHTAISVSTCR